MNAPLDHDPIADELLAAGWYRDVRDGWWRSPGSRAMQAPDALRCARRDRERDAEPCGHHDLRHEPAQGTDVEGAVLVCCVACGWSRTATPDVRAA